MAVFMFLAKQNMILCDNSFKKWELKNLRSILKHLSSINHPFINVRQAIYTFQIDQYFKIDNNILQFFIWFYFSYKARYNSVLSKYCTFLLSVNRDYVNTCHHTVSPFKDHKKMVKVKSYSTKVLVYLNSVLYEASYTTTESSCSGLWGTIALCKN